MKRILLFVMLVFSVKNYSQVSVSPSDRGANEEFKKGQLENFKKTTTVFVLPDLHKKEDYEKILKEVWTVTPYKVVDFKDFKLLDFTDGSYSFAEILGDILLMKKSNMDIYGTVYVHTNFVVRVLNKEKFEKEFAKLKNDDEKYNKKLRNIFDQNLSYIARVPLCANVDFLREAMGAFDIMKGKFSDEKLSEAYLRMYTKQSFTNINLGMLKNYFQEINKLTNNNEHCGLYDDFVTPEVKKLNDNILYIPEAYLMEYDSWKFAEKYRNEKDIKKLMEDYKYKFEFIKDEDLEKKILNNEEIYYLRYVSMNANKYLQVVNAKTGAPLYYFYGIASYNLKDDDFRKISKAASK